MFSFLDNQSEDKGDLSEVQLLSYARQITMGMVSNVLIVKCFTVYAIANMGSGFTCALSVEVNGHTS